MAALDSSAISNTRRWAIPEKYRREVGKTVTVLICIVPGMTIFLAFLLIPMFQSARYSVYDWDGFGPPTDYVGTGNYELLYHNEAFRDSVRNSFIIMLLSLGIQLPLAMGLALTVGRGSLPGKAFFRMVLFVPYVFSEVITGIIWRYVLHPSENGLVNVLMGNFPNYETIGWLSDKSIVLYAIFAVITWKYFGLHMILYMAGLQAVNKDLEDAARIDGANEWRVLRYVTLPLTGPTIRLSVFLSILGAFQVFIIIWTMTQGGPVNSSQVIATYLYKYGIRNMKLGLGSAIAMILFGITLIFSLGYQRMVMRQDYGE
jgi:raffinose/stachyose/melibiose transport system permease protein